LIADIVVAVVLLISGVIGLFRGFVKETLTIAGWIGAILITLYGYPFVSPLLASFITDSFIANLITASVLFLVSLVLLTILTHMIANRVGAGLRIRAGTGTIAGRDHLSGRSLVPGRRQTTRSDYRGEKFAIRQDERRFSGQSRARWHLLG
jgi:hypothetical protein